MESRVIKFRGKAKLTKEWVFGFLCEGVFGDKLIQNKRGDAMIVVIPETIGQFTGLTDKNENEIYEGDVINASYGKGEVVWEASLARFEYHFALDNDQLYYYADTSEIAGNIFDNPELLNKENK